jgi:hypothetical protein
LFLRQFTCASVGQYKNFDETSTLFPPFISIRRTAVIGGWEKLHNGELHGCYFSPDITVTNNGRWDWGGMRRIWDESMYRNLVGKSQGKRPFWRPRYRCTKNIKLYRNGIRYEEVDRTDQDQGTDNQRDVVKPVINFQLQSHFLSNWETVSFWRNILPHAVILPRIFYTWGEKEKTWLV